MPSGWAPRRRVKYLGGGTNLVDLLRETIERPAKLIDVVRLSNAIEEREDGSLLIGAAARNTAVAEHPAIRTRYPRLSPRHPRRRVGADPEHGDGRGQPAAAHALHVLLRPRRIALQQAGTRSRLRCDRRLQPHARHSRHFGGLHRDAPVRYVRRAGSARRRRARHGRERGAHHPRSPICIACPTTVPTSRRPSSRES